MIDLQTLKNLLTDNQICATLPSDKVPSEIKDLYPNSKGFIICPAGSELNEEFKQQSVEFENLKIWCDELDKN